MDNYYEMVYQEHNDDEYDLVIAVLESYAHDIRKVLKRTNLSLEERLKEARRLLNQFKKDKMTSWFDDTTISYVVENLEKEIKEYESEDN